MIPEVYCNLISFEIMKLDKLLIPLLNTVQWSSIEAMDVMLYIKKNFDYTSAFVQRVKRA